MGSHTSKSEIFVDSLQLFSEDEKLKIQDIYTEICGNNSDGFSEADLLKYGEAFATDFIMRHLFFYMKSFIHYEPGEGSNDLLVNSEEFLVSLAMILKGTADDRIKLIKYLCSGGDIESVKASQLKQLIEHLLECYVRIGQKNRGSPLTSWSLHQPHYTDNFCRSLLHNLIYKDTQNQADMEEAFPWESAHSTGALDKWLSQNAILLVLLRDVFHTTFPISVNDILQGPPLVPKSCGAPWGQLKTILDVPSLFFLNQALRPDKRGEWRFLFSTAIHGESFSTMMAKIQHRGPCLMVIKDTDDHVFGGFADQSWTLNPQFVGSSDCFLFSLSPIMEIYQPTGYNKHYMYLNHGQETMPNGLGMGGQLDYFGLWLDSEFGKGQSRAQPRCTTYNSPQLSKQDHFNVKAIEVWAIGPEPAKPQPGEGPGSILDKDPGAKAMLELLNKGPVSEGLREEDPMADSPEDHTLKN